jgi:hypothetical protein
MKRDLSAKKLVLIFVLCYCLSELIEWTGIFGRRFPRSWDEALVQAFFNILSVALFLGIWLFKMSRRPD